MKCFDILKTRKSVHTFTGESATEDTWQKIQAAVEAGDSSPGLQSCVTRLTLTDSGLGGRAFSGELGWVVGSMFVPKDDEKKNMYQIDLAFRMFKLSVELSKLGLSTCFASYSINQEKALEVCKEKHEMEYETPLALCFGFESKKGKLLAKVYNFFSHNSYRMPIDQIIENFGTSNKTISERHKELLSYATRSPSIGNSQTWRVVVEAGKVSFYAVSDLPEKFFNVGCFMAAFDVAAKEMKFKGEWVVADHPTIDGVYCLSFI